jgi:hypothetical protein
MALLVVVSTFVLMFLAFGSVVLPAAPGTSRSDHREAAGRAEGRLT